MNVTKGRFTYMANLDRGNESCNTFDIPSCITC